VPQVDMIGSQRSIGSSTELKGSVGSQLLQCGSAAFRVTEISEVICRFTGQHLKHRRKCFRRRIRPTNPAIFTGEGTDCCTCCLQARRHADSRCSSKRSRGRRGR
jgi:hypothetical protein